MNRSVRAGIVCEVSSFIDGWWAISGGTARNMWLYWEGVERAYLLPFGPHKVYACICSCCTLALAEMEKQGN